MAKIIAKQSKSGRIDVTAYGRMNEVALLAVAVVDDFGARVRATLEEQGAPLPDNDDGNNFMLALSVMHNAAAEAQRELAAEAEAKDTAPANDPTHH